MNKKLLSCFLFIVLTLLLVVPSAFATPILKWEAVKSDTMTSWDTTMSTVPTAFLPLSSSIFYPTYPKPNNYMQFKVRYSGLYGEYYFKQGSNVTPYTILNTNYNSDGTKTDTIQVAVSDLSQNNNGEFIYTTWLFISGFTSSAERVTTLSISTMWAL